MLDIQTPKQVQTEALSVEFLTLQCNQYNSTAV